MATNQQSITEDRASGAQVIDGSSLFSNLGTDFAAGTYLKRTPSSAGNTRTWTWSAWVKRGGLYSNGNNMFAAFVDDNNRDTIRFGGLSADCFEYQNRDGGTNYGNRTDAVYRDVSGWYHAVIVYNSTASSPRVKYYINGSQVTPLTNQAGGEVSSDLTSHINTTGAHYIGVREDSSGVEGNFDGRMSHVYFIDGQALDASYFGYTDELTNTWRPKKYTGDYTFTYTIPQSGGALPLLDTDDNLGQVASSPEALRTDSDSGNLSLALVCNTTGNLTDDKSSNSSDPTNNGVTASTTESHFYGTSARFDGDDWMATPSSSTFDMSTGDFTVEAWINLDNFDIDVGANPTIFGNSGGSYQQQVYVTGAGKVIAGNSGSSHMESTTTLVAGTWYHIAVTRSSSTGRLFINGNLEDTESSWTTDLNGTTYYIGAFDNGSNGKIHGYLADIRIYKGVARYTSSFIAAGSSGGLNSFYLPFDGSALIGNDQSGNGNDWTPTLMGSAPLEKATGAFPILNTINGGTIASPGVRGQAGVAVTVYNSGSGNKYYLDGAEAGTVSFIPGQTVTFDTSDTTNSGHPFRLSGLSDGTHHSTTLYSVSLDGTDDGLKSDNDSSDYYFDGDFTLEYFCYPDVDPDGNVTIEYGHIAAGGSANAWQVYHSNYVPRLWTSTANVAGTVSMTQSVWNHVVFCRKGSTLMSFVNGQSSVCATGYPSSIGGADSDNTLNIGFQYNLGPKQWFDGKISNVRIVKGTCLYTQDFAPPAVPLANVSGTTVLCCQSSSVTDATVLPSGHSLTTEGSPASSTDAPQTFTTGVVTGAAEASAGAATTITIPSNIQTDTLYYYCSNHSGMGGAISIGASDPSVADPYAWKNILAAPLDYSATDYSNLVNCTATARTLTVDGPTAGSESNFYNNSYYWDGSDDKITAPNSTDFNLKSGGWTAECWARPQDDSDQVDLITYLTTTTGWYMFIDSNMKFGCGWQVSGGSYQEILSPANSVNWDKWQHFAAVCDSGTVKLYLNGILQSDTEATSGDSQDPGGGTLGIGWKGGSYPDWLKGNIQDARIYHICKYTENFIPASTNPDILLDTPSGVAYGSNLTKVTSGAVVFDGSDAILDAGSSSDLELSSNFTVEFWVYPAAVSDVVVAYYYYTDGAAERGWHVGFGGSPKKFNFRTVSAATSGVIYSATTPSAYRWYHVAAVNNAGTAQIYVNGVADGASGTLTTPTYEDVSLTVGGLVYANQATGYGNYFEGFISNLRIINGTALYTSNFTPPTSPLTNITNTKLLCCQGTNAANYVVSPNAITVDGNAAAVTSNPFDTNINTVRGKLTGYCTWNPLWKNSTQSNSTLLPTLRDGNLTADYDDSGSQTEFKTVCGTIALDSSKGGKWYFETTSPGGDYYQVGMCREEHLWQIGKSGWGISGSSRGLCYQSDGSFGINRGSLTTSKRTASTYGQLISLLIDFDNETLNAWVEGVDVGYTVDISSYIDVRAPFWYPMISMGNFSNALTNDDSSYTNFGQKPFKYTPPEGFNPICLENLSSPGVVRPDQYVGIVTYTGDGNSPRSITGFDFQPDLVVYKERSEDRDWQWYDSVRGVGPAKNLVSNTNYAQASNDDTSYGYTSAFIEGGFTVTDGTGGGNANIYTNKSGETYVSYCWKAGGNSNTFNVDDVGYASAASAGLTGGDITPTGASVGTKQGFSIIKFTGSASGTPSIPHGLSEAPRFIIQKDTGATTSWRVFAWVGDFNWQIFNLDNGDAGTNATETAPTSSLFYANGNGNAANTQIAYLWHNVPGVQKFGTYSGNQNADGPWVDLGFRPAILMIKSSSASSTNWRIIDDTRRPYNWGANDSTSEGGPWLKLNSYNDEDNERPVDLLSNGFKIQGAWGGDINYDSDTPTYIYAAWAHQPFHNLYSGQSNAR